jgi:hypothetical protein
MTFCCYGPADDQKPAFIDTIGALSDLSSHVADLAGQVVEPRSAPEIRGIGYQSPTVAQG